jgi:antitoxin (DNA-binding transcriptional repressor) of toxin-antitoxin stability system
MSSLYTMSEARARLAQLLDEVERGVDVVITRHGRPAARLVYPALPTRKPPTSCTPSTG